MSDPVASTSTTSTPTATAQPAPAEATAAVQADAEEAAPDPEAELEAHVQHALKAGKRKEAAAKAKETKATAPAKKAAKPATEPAASPAEEQTGKPADEPPPAVGSLAKARKLLNDGDIDGAFAEAFGKKPQDFNINSKRWEEHRKAVQRDKRQLTQTQAELRQAANELHQTYAPYHAAQKAWESGDIEGAIKLAFKSDVTDFNKKLIKAAHGKNPEVEALRAELRARDEREAQARAEREAAEHEANAANARRQYVENMQSTLASSDDEQLAFLSKKRTFIGRVFEILQDHYDERSNTTLPILEAADMARSEDEFIDIGPRHAGATAATVQGGSNPARPEARASQTLSQQGATEASAPPRGWHGQSLDDQVRQFVSPVRRATA